MKIKPGTVAYIKTEDNEVKRVVIYDYLEFREYGKTPEIHVYTRSNDLVFSASFLRKTDKAAETAPCVPGSQNWAEKRRVRK